MAVLTNLDKVSDHLGIGSTDSAEDNLLVQLIEEVEQVVFEYTGRGEELGQSLAFTEYYDGTGRHELWLRKFPVTSVTTLSVDGGGYYGKGTTPFPSSTDWTEGTEFAIPLVEESEKNRGKVVALGSVDFRTPSVWPRGTGNIKVIYRAGYSAAPRDLEMAVHMLVAKVRNDADKGVPLASETLGKYAYTVLMGGKKSGLEVLTIRSILGRYVA